MTHQTALCLAMGALTFGCGANKSAPAPEDLGVGGVDLAIGVDAVMAPDTAVARPLPPLPLHTSDRWIVDATNHRFKLASVSWYGAEEMDYVVGGLDEKNVHAIASTR